MKTNQELKKLGYSDKDIYTMSDKKYAHVRFSPEEVLFLEQCVGKEIKIKTIFANGVREEEILVTSISMGVVACSFAFPGFMISSITKKSVISGMSEGVFIRDKKDWNYNSKKGTITWAK